MAYKEAKGYQTTEVAVKHLSEYAREDDVIYAIFGHALRAKLFGVLTVDEDAFLRASCYRLFLRAKKLGEERAERSVRDSDRREATAAARKELLRELIRLLEEEEV
jgi:hypothetical protein